MAEPDTATLLARIAALEDALFDLADLVPEWRDQPSDEAVDRARDLLGPDRMAEIRAERAARPRPAPEPRQPLDPARYGRAVEFTTDIAPLPTLRGNLSLADVPGLLAKAAQDNLYRDVLGPLLAEPVTIHGTWDDEPGGLLDAFLDAVAETATRDVWFFPRPRLFGLLAWGIYTEGTVGDMALDQDPDGDAQASFTVSTPGPVYRAVHVWRWNRRLWRLPEVQP